MRRASRVFGSEARKTVDAAIAEVETRTAAEIVVVAATRSGRYDRAEDLFGLAVGLVVSFAAWIGWEGGGDAQWETFWTRVWPGLALGLIFVTVFAAGTVLAGRVFRLARPFVTRGEMLAEVKRSAAEAFLRGRVGRTANGTGMLVYVSLVERMVWIVGDDAVSGKVDDAVFAAARDRVLRGFREGRPAEGVADAVRGCADALAAAFPIGDDDVNEIRNDMVVLD